MAKAKKAIKKREIEKAFKYSRLWKCPKCKINDFWVSYEELAEVGSPLCPECDVEMDCTKHTKLETVLI